MIVGFTGFEGFNFNAPVNNNAPLSVFDYTSGNGGTLSIVSGMAPDRTPGSYPAAAAMSQGNAGFGWLAMGYQVANQPKVIIGADVLFAPDNGDGSLFQANDDIDGFAQISIWYEAVAGTLAVRRKADLSGNNGTIIASAAIALDVTQWHRIEAVVTIDAAAGTVLVYVDGSLAINFTGNTKGTTHGFITSAAFNKTGLESTARNTDNFYVLDGQGSFFNDSLGALTPPYQVTSHFPKAKGVYSEWNPNPSVNFGQVNDYYQKVLNPSLSAPVPDGDLSFIWTDGTAFTDTYKISPFTVNGIDREAIQILYSARSTGGVGLQVRSTILQGGTLYPGTPFTIGAGDADYHTYIDSSFMFNDPSTALPWTTAGLRSAEFGVTALSGGGDQVWISQIMMQRFCRGPVTTEGGVVSYARIGKANLGVSF